MQSWPMTGAKYHFLCKKIVYYLDRFRYAETGLKFVYFESIVCCHLFVGEALKMIGFRFISLAIVYL